MPLPKPLITHLLRLTLPLIASGCAKQVIVKPIYPPEAVLHCTPPPIPPIDILTSDKASADYDAAIEAAGDDCRAKVIATCQWAKANGKDVKCH